MDIQQALDITPDGFKLTEFTASVITYRGEPDIVIEYNQTTLNWNMRILNVIYSAKTLDDLMTKVRTIIKTICTTLEA